MENDRIYRFMLSEQELIEGCRRGERSFQKALYELYCRKMMVVCLRYSKKTAEAEDILQELFIGEGFHVVGARRVIVQIGDHAGRTGRVAGIANKCNRGFALKGKSRLHDGLRTLKLGWRRTGRSGIVLI